MRFYASLVATSYIHRRAERNLTSTPHLLSFFVRFILRNRVVPEPAYQRGLKRALGTIELAKKELPLTYKIGHILPDAFSQACKESFGRKGTVNWTRIAADLPEGIYYTPFLQYADGEYQKRSQN